MALLERYDRPGDRPNLAMAGARSSRQGAAPKSVHNMHGLLSAAMHTAELLGYISCNPCRGIPLPTIQRAEDEANFLTHAEFSLLLEGMDGRYKTFTQFLVMTGTRFGEATAIRVADIDLLSRPPTARVNKAWKRDGQSRYYVGPAKTGAGKRTIGLNPALVDLLLPMVASRAGSELLFTTAGLLTSISGNITGCRLSAARKPAA